MSAQLRALTIQNGTTQRLAAAAMLQVGAGVNSVVGQDMSVEVGDPAGILNLGVASTTGAINIGTNTTGLIKIGNLGNTVEFPGTVSFTASTVSPDVTFSGNVIIGSNPLDPTPDYLTINSNIKNSPAWITAGYANASMMFDFATNHAIGVETNAVGAGGALSLFAGEGTGAAGGNLSIAAGGTNGAFQGGNLSLTAATSSLGGAGGSAGLAAGGAGATTAGTGGNLVLVAGGASSVGAFSSIAGTGGAVTVKAGDSGLVAGSAGGAVSITAGTSTAGAGGALTLASGAGGGVGAGGDISLTASAGGLTSGTGGNVTITSGQANGGAAGTATLQGGIGSGALAAGSVHVYGGASGITGVGGGVSIVGGAGTNNAGGAIGITAGASGNGNAGGTIALTAGTASGFSLANGGAIGGTAGNGCVGGVGGAIAWTAGNGQGSGDGGALTLRAGVSGATGAGGAVVIVSGASAGAGGAAGPVTINSGVAAGGTPSGVAIANLAQTAAVTLGDGATNSVLVHSGLALNAGSFEIFNQRMSFAPKNGATGAASPTGSYLIQVENTTTNSVGGGLQVRTGNGGPGNNNAGVLALLGGTATGTGAGGDITITGGQSGPTAGTVPGLVSVNGGQAAGGSGSSGGDIILTGGQGDLTGDGGHVIVQGGTAGASGNGGYVNIVGSNGVLGGNVAITTGSGSTATTGGTLALQYATSSAVLIKHDAGTGALTNVVEIQAASRLTCTGTGTINLPNNTGPSSVFFQVGGVAVTAPLITAAGFDTVFGGPASNANAYHTHTGITGATSVIVDAVGATGEAFLVGSPVCMFDGGTAYAYLAGASTANRRNVLGISTTAFTGNNVLPVHVQLTGLITVPAASFANGAVPGAAFVGLPVWYSTVAGKLVFDPAGLNYPTNVGDSVQKVGVIMDAAGLILVQVGDTTTL